MRVLLTLALVAGFSSHAFAGTACPQFYLDGKPPVVTEQADDRPATELCNTAFATLWSPVTRDPVYSAEHLTAQGLMFAKDVKRVDAFHADQRLPDDTRATLADYRGSRLYDRGHMAPEHDSPNADAVRESFVLTNMIPQIKSNNRGPWAQIEETTRNLVVSVYQGEGWVVTGPAFGLEPKRLRGRVSIPDRLWKAVYIPAKPEQHNDLVVGAWIVANAADPQTRFVSLDALKAETGVDPFPSLSPELHATVALPDAARKRTLP